jgi:hypothetical protein
MKAAVLRLAVNPRRAFYAEQLPDGNWHGRARRADGGDDPVVTEAGSLFLVMD